MRRRRLWLGIGIVLERGLRLGALCAVLQIVVVVLKLIVLGLRRWRVLGRAGRAGLLYEAIQERKVRIAQVLARSIHRQDFGQSTGIARKLAELYAPLLQVDVQARAVLVNELRCLHGEARKLRADLHHGRHAVSARVRRHSLPASGLAQHLEHFGQAINAHEVRILAERPKHHSQQNVRKKRLLEHVVKDFTGLAPHGLVGVLAVLAHFVVAHSLCEKAKQIMRHLLLHKLATKLKHLGHRPNVPNVARCKALGELANPRYQVLAQKLVDCSLEEKHELVHDHLGVHRVGHAEQQVQCLALERLVRVFQAVQHHHLMLGGVARVVSHHRCETGHTKVLEVVAVALDEPRDCASRSVQQHGVGVDRRYRVHALVHDCIADVDARVGTLHAVVDHIIHLLARTLVVLAKDRENLEQLDLDPWRRDAVVVKIFRQSMLDDLLENGRVRAHQVFLARGVLSGKLLKQAERGSHHGRVFVT
mmetsp:Transcript_1346/g.3977  ORF Transcript_1346/g.3977 Transcript_1346/m.3977 type:complete len:477 (-) Transcript_1346:541-1971(-)